MAEPQQRVLEREADGDATSDGGAVDAVQAQRPGIQWLTDEEANAMFDREARQVMGMSGEEFLRRYDAGEFDDMPDDSEHLDYWDLVLSIPFGR